jgi:hypothetical protein
LNETKQTDSALSQVQFVHETLYGDKKNVPGEGNVAKIVDALKGDDIKNATKVFCELWEKPSDPHLERRLEQAQLLLQGPQQAQQPLPSGNAQANPVPPGSIQEIQTEPEQPQDSGVYRIQQGDTLFNLAQKNNMTLEQLLAIEGNEQFRGDPNSIQPNQEVRLTAPPHQQPDPVQ